MTVWARSDVAAVSISPAHGGCGDVHGRPVVEGAPVKVWALTCHSGCEDFLRNDPLWSGTAHEIPETPDETAQREDADRRGQVEQQKNMTSALIDLAKLGDLPDALVQIFKSVAIQQRPELTALDVMCPNGHRNPATAKFCADCGTAVTPASDEPRAVDTSASAEDVAHTMSQIREAADETGTEPVVTDMSDLAALPLKDLQQMAEDLGIASYGTKSRLADVITRARSEQGDQV